MMKQFRQEIRCGFMQGHSWRYYTRGYRRCDSCGRVVRGKTN